MDKAQQSQAQQEGGGQPARKKPGPKAPHRGQFFPGDPRINYSGRPKKGPEMKELEQLCRESAQTALDFLLDAVTSTEYPANVRLQAAREVLDRGFGKPVDRQVQLQLSNGGRSEGQQLTDDQLLRIAAGALGEQARDPAQVIEFRGKSEGTPPSDLKQGDENCT